MPNQATVPQTRFTKDTGSIIKPGPMVTAEPELTITDDQLQDLMTVKEGNPAYLADTIVSFEVHENMGINLFRTLQNLTDNPVLKPQFSKFERDAKQAAAVYQQLQQALGIPAAYISPAGRSQESTDQHLITAFIESGSADTLTQDMAAVNATLVAASMCVANVELLQVIAEGLDDETAVAAVNTAVSQLAGPSQEHLDWAKSARATMAKAFGQSKLTQKAAAAAETAAAKVKNALS